MGKKHQSVFEISGSRAGKSGRWRLRAASIVEAERIATEQGVSVDSAKLADADDGGRTGPDRAGMDASPPSQGPKMIVTRSGEVRPEDFYDRIWAWTKRVVPAIGRGAGKAATAAGSVAKSAVSAVAADRPLPADTHVCLNCGMPSSPIPKRDNAGCGCLLTLLFLLPGLLWYAFTPLRMRCIYCWSENVIPAGSPKAQEVLAAAAQRKDE